MDDLLNVAQSNIARIVTFVVTPLLLPVAAIVANWLQDAAGLNLDGAQLTAYVVAVIAGLALMLLQWLRGRAHWEVAIAELMRLHQLGQANLPQQPVRATDLRK